MKKKKTEGAIDRKEGQRAPVESLPVKTPLEKIADSLESISVTLDNVFIEVMKDKVLEEMCKNNSDFDFFDK